MREEGPDNRSVSFAQRRQIIPRKNPLVMRIFADVLNRPVAVAGEEQAAALGYCLLYAQRNLMDGKRTLQQIAGELDRLLETRGPAALCEQGGVPFLARPRPQEICACFNRYRGLLV